MKMNSFRRLFSLGFLVGLSCVPASRAQFAAYGTVTGERLKDIACTDARGCASSNGTTDPYGGTIGAFYDFRSYGRITLGADVRASFLNANKSAYSYQASNSFQRHDSFLGGARATFRTPFHVLRPYAQISAGLGRTNATAPPLTNGDLNYKSFTQIQAFAGLDLALFDNVDLRAIEFGAGEMFGSGSHNIQSVGIGIVFHTTR